MKQKNTTDTLPVAAVDEVRQMTQEEFEDPYNLPDDFWEAGEVHFADTKVPVSIRLDASVVEWFKQQGRGYQSRINAVLRAYMKAQVRAETDTKPPAKAK
jgi:uncharacterized protein (DUF4415 family)